MDYRNFSIGLLSVTALVMSYLLMTSPHPAGASVAIKDRDYQLVTARSNQGGEVLYVTENRTGMMAVLSYDTASRSIKVRASGRVGDAFAPAR